MAKKKSMKSPKRGPKPETLKIEGDWHEAVKVALKRGKPPKKSPKQSRSPEETSN